MAFDWFRRKFNADDDKGKDSEPKADESKATGEQDSAESDETSGEEAEDNDDYLEFAKAAFQNIKSQQSTTETESAETEAEASAPEVAAVEEDSPEPEASVPESAPKEPEPAQITETVAEEAESSADPAATAEPIATETAATASEPAIAESVVAVEPEESQPEAAEPTVAASESADVEEVTAEPAPKPSSTEPEPAEASESEATPEPATTSESETAPEPEATPEPEAAPEPKAAPEPALSFLARAEAEREERLERLQATAIEEPEPEPEPEEEYVDDGYGPGVVFDEDFIWSAEVLAAQGRRADQISAEEITWLKRLRQGLGKTRLNLINQLKSIVGQGPLNEDAVDEIESLLLQADVGVDATDYIIESLQAKLKEEVLPPAQAIAYLKRLLRELLDSPLSENDPPVLAPEKDRLNIWLMTGVNGAGKTTTIGKLAHLATKSDYRCLIAAADTFRAAAVQQVQVWGERSGIEVIANPGQNTDPAAVVYDAVEAARSRNTELLLVDTAGRLQNKKNLMAELSKVRRIIDKKAPEAKVESLLVLDATLGQNGLRQAEVFAQAAELSGVVLTKLDGTARGGVALAVVKQLGLPIRFIGAGEGIGDLRPFSSYEFIEALLSG